MQRITALDPDTTTGKAKELFNTIQTKFGMIPNMMRTMGHAPAVLNGCLSFSGHLAESSIGMQLSEQIALTVANITGCNYCNTSHSFVSEKLLKMDAQTIYLAKQGNATDTRARAALQFAKTLVLNKGNVSDKDLHDLKNAGFSEEAVCEIIAHTAFNIFTNYFNKAANVKLDFPEAELVGATTA